MCLMQVEMIVYCVERVCHCKQSKLIHFFYPQNSISSMAVKNDARRMAIKEVNLFICTKIIETTLMHKVECSRNFLCEKISFKKIILQTTSSEIHSRRRRIEILPAFYILAKQMMMFCVFGSPLTEWKKKGHERYKNGLPSRSVSG